MKSDQVVHPLGAANAGVCVTPPRSCVLPAVRQSLIDDIRSQRFSVEIYETFLNSNEQIFYDWSIGMLEDAGVVGVLINDNVYLGSSLQAAIVTGPTPAYTVTLTRNSVEFGLVEADPVPISFGAIVMDAGEEEIEANQVGRAFKAIRRQSAFLRAWKECTSLASANSTLFSDLRFLDQSEIELDLEIDLGEFTVNVRPRANLNVFDYTVMDNRLGAFCSPLIADGILSYAASDVRAVRSPSPIVCAMIGAAEGAQNDREWLAAGVRGPLRPR